MRKPRERVQKAMPPTRSPAKFHGRHHQPSVVAPKTVAEKIPETLRSKTTVRILANGEKTKAAGIAVEAVPAYNTTPGKERFHPKGRDNVTGRIKTSH